MVISQLIRAAADRLPSENALFEAEQLVMKVIGTDRTGLVLGSRNEIGADAVERTAELVKRRASGEPLQYILGECGFMSLDFYTDRGALIPRPDTETLVEAALDRIRDRKNVLDLCSGSGCVGISMAYGNKNINVTLADISDRAIALSGRNIVRHGLSDRVKTMKTDILKDCPDSKYDMIVSNPPYIETDVIPTLMTEVRDYEPRIALDGGADGLIFYRRIADIAPRLLTEDGIIVLEIGYNQGERVSALLARDFDGIEIIKDLCGNDRVAAAVLK